MSSDSTGRACRLSQFSSEDTDFPLCPACSLPSAIWKKLNKYFFSAAISTLLAGALALCSGAFASP